MNQLQTKLPTAAARAMPPRVALISALWHRNIVDQARLAALAEFERWRPGGGARVDEFDVPGAFEIPLLAQQLARTGRYEAILCCALVVDGGIYRHDFVATAVIDGLMRVGLDSGVPVLSAVLTPHDFHEHEVHQRFFAEHFVKKGTELAQACLAIVAQHRAVAER